MRYSDHYNIELVIGVIVFLILTGISATAMGISLRKHWFQKKNNYEKLKTTYTKNANSIDYRIYVWATQMQTYDNFTRDVGLLVDLEHHAEAWRRVKLFATGLYRYETLKQIMLRMEL